MSDGCIYLLRELSFTGEKACDLVVKNLQNLADLGYVDHFKHAQNLKENLFKSLKEMITSAEGLGKKKYRPYVELFLDPAFRVAQQQYSQEHQSLNCALAGSDFVLALGKTYGEGIFKAILEGHDERYVAKYAEFKQEASQAYIPQPFVPKFG